MTIEQIASVVIDACEQAGVEHMVAGAFLDDARDVLAVQGPETLDMAYITDWCGQHGTLERLQAALAGIPPL